MEPNPFSVITATADILGTPNAPKIISNQDSQLLFGETFNVVEAQDEWLRGASTHDDYEGFVHISSLVPQACAPTHFVDIKLSALYPAPDFKTRPLTNLSMLSRLTLTGEDNNEFVNTQRGWIFKSHIKKLEEMSNTAPLDTAMVFLGTPYLYGGRSALGIDCSGLVQIALMRAGIKNCARDSGPQSQTVGENIDIDDLRAGDLVFFKGHVGIMIDDKKILNATARTMDTRIEPLGILIDFYGPITTARRL